MRRFLLIVSIVPALGLGLSSCGGDDEDARSTEPKGKPDPAASRIAQQYVDAYTAHNAVEICSLLASSVREQLSVKKPCVVTVRKTLKQEFPKFVVLKSYADGDTAIVTFKGTPRRVTLTRESSDWKVIDGGT